MLLRGLRLLGSLVALLAAAPAFAIDPDRTLTQLHHAAWTARDGAPTDVEMLAQTEDGFLWFATRSGLVRFDGAQFERYKSASGDALPSGSIRSLLALPGNGLIVGWIFGGASLLRDGRVTNFGKNEGYPTGTTYQFLVDSDGKLWAATADALARFDGTRWHVIGADWNFGGQRAVALFLDRDGTLGAFTQNSLMTLPKGSTAFQPTGAKTSTRRPLARLPDGTLIASDARGIRTISSIATYDESQRVLVETTTANARRMVVDKDGAVWFEDNRGVGRIAHPGRPDATAEYFSKSEGLSDTGAVPLIEDRAGNVWVATANGIDRFRVGPFLLPTGALQVNFAAMAPDAQGGLLVTGFKGDSRHVGADGGVREFGPIRGTCAYRDPDGVVWFGAQQDTPRVAELWRYQENRLERVALPADIPPNAVVQSITMDASRTLWISVRRAGIYRLSEGAWSKPAELPDTGRRTAVVMMADAKGRVWLSYGSEVALWDQGKVRTYTAKDGLAVGVVHAIHEKGTHLWMAGEGGLAVLDSDRFRSLRTEDPEVLRGLKGLAETSAGDLWLHGSTGAVNVKADQIRRALSDSTHAMSYRLFDYDDGFAGVPTDLGPLPTLVEGTDGRLWFATNRGVFMLDPRLDAANRVAPAVVVNALVADGTRHLPGPSVGLPALTTSLQVDYAATTNAVPRRTRYRYRLSGVDRDWQEAGARRQAFYTNLGPGNYRFEVIAANEDGVWTRTRAAVDFAIAPAWYQTWWFAALCILGFLGLLAFLYRVRVHQVRSQIQERLQERLLERERIARELHDTLIQGFQGLVLTLGAGLRRLTPGESRDAMEQALRRAQDMLAQGRDRVRDLRDSVGFDGDLPAALKDAAGLLSVTHPAEFALSVSGEPRPLHPLAMEEAYLISREALANAFQHAAAKRIEVEIDNGESQLRVRIRDDGKGMAGDVVDKGMPGHWGMSGMRERAQRLGARLLVRSGQGAGTDVELEIPAKVAYRAEAVHAD